MPVTLSVYLVTLQKATPNPLLKESDEETGEADKEEGQGGRQGSQEETKETAESKDKEGDEDKAEGCRQADESKKDAATRSRSSPSSIDLDGIAGRIVALPVEPGMISDLAAGAEGQIYYIRRTAARPARGDEGAGQAVAPPVRPQDPRGGDAGRGDRGLPPLGRSQEDPLPRRRRRTGSSTPASSTRATARSQPSARSRSGSSPGPSGRRSSTRPGGSIATTSTPRTCTGPTGTPSGESTRRSCLTWRPAATSTA